MAMGGKLTNAQYLHKPLNNYSMLMAFVSGFSHSAVSRLKHTKALLQRSQLKVRILCARGDVMRGCSFLSFSNWLKWMR